MSRPRAWTAPSSATRCSVSTSVLGGGSTTPAAGGSHVSGSPRVYRSDAFLLLRKGPVVTPRFGARGWGAETLGLSPDDGVLDLAVAAANIAVPEGLSPRAATATFFASGDGAPDGDLCYVQHLHHLDWDASERAVLEMSVRALGGALRGAWAADTAGENVMGIDVVDDEHCVAVTSLAAAMQVPPPRQVQWSSAMLAVYVPNAFNLVRICWGAVKDPAVCQYSTNELVANSLRLIRNLWLTNVIQDNTT